MNSAQGAGLLFGAFFCGRAINRFGYIKAFNLFSLGLALMLLCQAKLSDPIFWILFRGLSGVVISGIYLAIESWLAEISSDSNRGRAFGWYMVILYLAQSVSQILLIDSHINTLIPYVGAALLCVISVAPMCLTKLDFASRVDSQSDSKGLSSISRVGLAACFFAGLVVAPAYGLLPVHFQYMGLSATQVGQIMSALLLGALFFQWPIGLLSDRFPRVFILFALASVIVFVSLILLGAALAFFWLLAVIFLLGGAVFSIYPIAVAITCDGLAPKDMVAAASSLLFTYSIGALIGPIIAPLFMNLEDGFFLYLGAVSLLTGMAIALLIGRRILIKYAQTSTLKSE